ncbi:hypothetical protein ACOQFB_00995 [Anaeromyxobacter sp. Red801]|uniref:hypothetical protein n=1 Tax=Anaeromyxobacter sp. Red801 TaxID=3411632 RepID=UPI003B9EDF85
MTTNSMAKLTRRSFLTTVGVGAAVVTAPGAAAAASGRARLAAGGAVQSWPVAVEAMKAAEESVLAQFRPAYLAEVERFAEELRPRFEKGDLRASVVVAPGSAGEERAKQAALDRLEGACAERFGVEVVRAGYEVEGDDVLGRMICAVSPSAPSWDVDDGDWSHPCCAAQACACSDVVAVARRAGWGVRGA